MSIKNIIMTASDSKYFHFLSNLVDSYHKNAYRDDTAIRVIDLGLTEEQKKSLEGKIESFVEVEWHLKFKCLETAPLYRKAFTITPFLPHYCQDAETIIWIDADAWIQTPEAINGLIEAAKSNKMVVVPEVHHLYPEVIARGRVKVWNIPLLNGKTRAIHSWLRKAMKKRYGEKIASKSLLKPVYNAGIFAAKTNSPVWAEWAKCYQEANIKKISDLSDQAPLNYGIHTGRIAIHPLPAQYNWICDFLKPIYNSETNLFVEPAYPYNPLHIIHVLGKSKDKDLSTVNIDGTKAPYTILGTK